MELSNSYDSDDGSISPAPSTTPSKSQALSTAPLEDTKPSLQHFKTTSLSLPSKTEVTMDYITTRTTPIKSSFNDISTLSPDSTKDYATNQYNNTENNNNKIIPELNNSSSKLYPSLNDSLDKPYQLPYKAEDSFWYGASTNTTTHSYPNSSQYVSANSSFQSGGVSPTNGVISSDVDVTSIQPSPLHSLSHHIEYLLPQVQSY